MKHKIDKKWMNFLFVNLIPNLPLFYKISPRTIFLPVISYNT